MANKRIELAIPVPCQQRWQDMKPENTARFCTSCQKTVVDFTSIAIKRQRLGIMTAWLISWSMVQAQPTQVLAKNIVPNRSTVAEHSDKTDSSVQYEKAIREDSTWVIAGRVITEIEKDPIPGTTIQTTRIKRKNLGKATNAGRLFGNLNTILIRSNFGTVTDANGLFNFQVPNYKGDSLSIKVAFIGYISKEIVIRKAQGLPLVISLVEINRELPGKVWCNCKPTFFKRLKNRFRASR